LRPPFAFIDAIAECDNPKIVIKMENGLVESENSIKNKILTLRGQQVMVDRDLAELYEVPTKRLNEQVRRNIERFPEDFMFQLTKREFDILRSQFATANPNLVKIRYLPYVFTEQGVANLSSVLSSKKAIQVNILIMRAFVAMRRFLAQNAQVFYRLDNVEKKQIEHEITLTEHDRKFEQVLDAIESKGIKPEKGIFFNGQVFDAYRFVSDLVRSADKSIILIDNFVDDSVLTLFCKRKNGVRARIYTSRITKELKQDLEKYNKQYPAVEIRKFKHSHDRFMIIDNKAVYHIGASLKDLGKKWFGFSRFDRNAFKIIEKLE